MPGVPGVANSKKTMQKLLENLTKKDREELERFFVRCVSKQKWKSGWVNLFPEEIRDEVEVMHDEQISLDYEMEKHERGRKTDWAKRVAEWEMEEGGWARERRLEYLKEKRREVVRAYRDNRALYFRYAQDEPLIASLVSTTGEIIVREMKRLDMNIRVLETNKKSDINPYMISLARDYPIENVIEVNSRGFAKCLNHEEKTPSLYCKKNFAHCFGCHWHGDVIDIYMLKTGAKFPESVRTLCGDI